MIDDLAMERFRLLMSRTIGIFVAFLLIVASPCAKALDYSATVLFPINPPNGLSSPYAFGTQSGQFPGVAYVSGTYTPHAVLWSGPNGSALDLNPNGFTGSNVDGMDGNQFFGSGYGTSTGNNTHALLWSSVNVTPVDLHPTGFSGFTNSAVAGSKDGQQVGKMWYIQDGGEYDHAVLWSGSAASAIDLNPSGYAFSAAYATHGSQQVGEGTDTFGHALLWSGTAESAIDLNPDNARWSSAFGISATHQVGYSQAEDFNYESHATVWSGTAASAIDLNPSGFDSSYARATEGDVEVGDGRGPDAIYGHALAWTGSADSAVDLHLLLPAPEFSYLSWLFSTATAVDSQGNIFGTAQDSYGQYYAVEWSPVPEPGSCVLMAAAGAGLLLFRRLYLRRLLVAKSS